MKNSGFTIAAVERDTGLSKDLLRMWERRYGFPAPLRDGHGERCYSGEQVNRLRLIKRLMDQGYRPGKLMPLSDDELATLSPRQPAGAASGSGLNSEELSHLLSLIKQHDAAAYMQGMQQQLARHGLQGFVQDTIAPLCQQVGECWEDGRFEIFEEHLFTELTARLLRQAISTLPSAPRQPCILLTSVPDEPHGLGLLMVEALFALEGAACVPMGTQMPLLEIAQAAQAYQADVVALSFSVAFPHRQIAGLLEQLRQSLPHEIDLWAGGSGVRRVTPVNGVTLTSTLEKAVQVLHEWRVQRL